MKKVLPVLYKILSSKFFPLVLGFIAVALTFLSFQKGLAADDFFLRSKTLETFSKIAKATPEDKEKEIFKSTVLHTYDVIPKDNTILQKELMDSGTLPWWSSANLKYAFFRPVSAFTNWIDYRFWPNSLIAIHLQSVFWYALLCICVAMLYRRILPTVLVSALAGFLFTVDVQHLTPVVWLADRSRIISVVFGVLSVIFLDLGAKKKSIVYRAVSWILFLTTLLAAESGLAISAYIFSYVVFIEKETPKRKFYSILPYALIFFVWQFVYKKFGYGIIGMDVYIDPSRDPTRFLTHALYRTPVLFTEQWLNLNLLLPTKWWGFFGPSLFNMFSPNARFIYGALSVGVGFAIFALFLPLIKKSKTATFWFTGMIISVVLSPMTSITNGRELNFAGIGAAALLAQGSAFFLKKKARNYAGVIIVFLLIIHAIVSPVQFFIFAKGPNQWQQNMTKFTDIGSHTNLSKKKVIFVNVPSSQYVSSMMILRRRFYNQPIPASRLVLAHGYYDIEISRLSENQLQVKNDSEFPARSKNKDFHTAYLNEDVDKMLYSLPLKTVADEIEADEIIIKIQKRNVDGFPEDTVFTFPNKLENSKYLWLRWNWEKEKYEEFKPPKVGETIKIPAPF